MSTTETTVGRDRDDQVRRRAELRDLDDREPAQLERDIDATRADVRATLAALEHRLSFDRLMELTIGRIRQRGGAFAGNLSDAVTQNPVPLLLTSLGVGWMMLTSRNNGGGTRPTRSERARASDSTTTGGMRRAAGQVGEQIHEAVDSSRDAVGHAADSLRAGASRAAETTREQIDHARERMDRLAHEQPLILGALGLAAGAIIGALLPTTEAEDRFIGDVRDKAVKSAARDSRNRYEAARENAAAYATPAADDERPSRPH